MHMGTAELHIERYLQPEVRVRLWRQSHLTTLCRIEGYLIADLVLGRSADARLLLEHLFATPQRIIDLRYASDPGVRPITVEHAARNLARWDVQEEGRVTSLIMESDLGYGLGRMLQAHGSIRGSEISICRSLEEVELLLDIDLGWYKHL